MLPPIQDILKIANNNIATNQTKIVLDSLAMIVAAGLPPLSLSMMIGNAEAQM
jgi:hypothetical protein